MDLDEARDRLALGGVGLWYGWRFLQLRNQLLGYEWFVLGGNSLNGPLFTTGLALVGLGLNQRQPAAAMHAPEAAR